MLARTQSKELPGAPLHTCAILSFCCVHVFRICSFSRREGMRPTRRSFRVALARAVQGQGGFRAAGLAHCPFCRRVVLFPQIVVLFDRFHNSLNTLQTHPKSFCMSKMSLNDSNICFLSIQMWLSKSKLGSLSIQICLNDRKLCFLFIQMGLNDSNLRFLSVPMGLNDSNTRFISIQRSVNDAT